MSRSERPADRESILATVRQGPVTLAGVEPGAEASAERWGSLLVLSGVPGDLGAWMLIEGGVEIGREVDGLRLRDARASRRHARVVPAGEGYVLQDLGSTNGVLLNGLRIGPVAAPLQDGDRIVLGQTVLKFTWVDATEAGWLRRMEQLAGLDALTGLIAKHRFDAIYQDAWQAAVRQARPLVVWMLDLDGLKGINDTHGHRYGAASITRLGELLLEHLTGFGEATRFGGDEFQAFTHCGLEEAHERAERVRVLLEERPVSLDGVEVRPTVTIGLASYDGDPGPAHLTERADLALYQAKRGGRNRIARHPGRATDLSP
jgi:diguanylate cyclase (GGDEF)-like protein